LFWNIGKSLRMHVVSRFARDRYASGFGCMNELAMTSPLTVKTPSVAFDHPQNIPNLHSLIIIIRTVMRALPRGLKTAY